MLLFRAAFFAVLTLLIATAPARAEKRVALIIGNSAYQHVSALPNPRNDAKAMGAALAKLGFDVDVHTDLTKADTDKAVRKFGDRLEGASVALFFYAGHGLQVNGVNYIVPIDAKIDRERDLQFEAVEIATVQRQMEEEKRVNLVFLDACRDNPLGRSLAGKSRSASVGRGLSPMPAATGTLISYATKDGTTAADGDGANSPYTTALLKHLATPGLDVGIMLRRVREDVLAATKNQQIPWDYGSLLGEFYLVPGAPPAPPAAAAETPKPAVVMNSVDPRMLELAIWDSIKTSTNPALFEDYIRQFPQGTFSAIARVKLEELKSPNRHSAAATAPTPTPTPAAPPAPGQPVRDCANCPELVAVSAGRFTMGSPGSELGREGNEGPQRGIALPRALAVSRFEVTFAEWDACVAEGGCEGYKPKDKGWGRGRMPAIYVSWDDAQSYVAWLSKKTGKPYRLLSEAEWEYVARAGSAGPFSTGASISTDQANYDGNSTYGNSRKGLNRNQTVEVGNYPANGFGVHDLHGNVWEWVADCYAPTLEGQPGDGSAREAAPCDERVVRGGSWYSAPKNLRAAVRAGKPAEIRSDRVGFRVVRPLS